MAVLGLIYIGHDSGTGSSNIVASQSNIIARPNVAQRGKIVTYPPIRFMRHAPPIRFMGCASPPYDLAGARPPYDLRGNFPYAQRLGALA